MKMIYAIYDSKVNSYGTPFFLRTKGEALRGWIDAINDPRQETDLAKHPEDFTLMELGEYDETSGVFENHTAPISLGVGLEFKKNQ